MRWPITSVEERFWAKVDKSGSCWLWTAVVNNDGYGKFRIGKRMVLAHRLSYEFDTGHDPESFNVLHSCDNPRCVNPKHLSLGTHIDNMKDKSEKKRQVTGSRQASAKLVESDIPTIRARLSAHEKLKVIAADYGVAMQQISLIKLGKTWRHVEDV